MKNPGQSIEERLRPGSGLAVVAVFGCPITPRSPAAVQACLDVRDKFLLSQINQLRSDSTAESCAMLPNRPTLTGVGVIGTYGFQIATEDNPIVDALRGAKQFLDLFNDIDISNRAEIGPVTCVLSIDVVHAQPVNSTSSSYVKPFDIWSDRLKQIQQLYEMSAELVNYNSKSSIVIPEDITRYVRRVSDLTFQKLSADKKRILTAGSDLSGEYFIADLSNRAMGSVIPLIRSA